MKNEESKDFPKRKVSEHKPKIKLGSNSNYFFVKETVSKYELYTICQSGNCPNISECWGNKTATFMILGNICTRGCKFCSVPTGKPLPPDNSEAEEVSRSVKLMGLKSCVITSVDRDDLADFGANHWANVIKIVKQNNPETKLEVLIPDFNANPLLLKKIIESKPEIISHNIETVERLSPSVRPSASYSTSLLVLKHLSSEGVRTKSGIMVGLGETVEEISKTLNDILNTGCKIITIGQYLQPEKEAIPVVKYYSDEEFYQLKNIAYSIGFEIVESGKLIRSSYHAEKHHI